MQLATKQHKFRGLNTAWLQGGQAQSSDIMLFLHGYPDAPQSWDAQLEHFAQVYTVVAPFSRGAWPSEQSFDVERYGREASALDHLQVLKTVDPTMKRKVVIVAHDLGVVHAWTLARLLGKRLRALVVINGLDLAQMLTRFREMPRQLLKSWYIPLMQIPALPEFLTAKFPEKLLDFAHAQGGLRRIQRPRAAQLRGAVASPLNQYRAFVRAIPKVWREEVRPLHSPVLVLWGAHDKFLLTPTTKEFDKYARQVSVRILEGNHWLHREKPQDVNRLIDDFLTSVH